MERSSRRGNSAGRATPGRGGRPDVPRNSERSRQAESRGARRARWRRAGRWRREPSQDDAANVQSLRGCSTDGPGGPDRAGVRGARRPHRRRTCAARRRRRRQQVSRSTGGARCSWPPTTATSRLARLLVERGADVIRPTRPGGRRSTLATRQPQHRGWRLPRAEAGHGRPEYIAFLLDHKADVNWQGREAEHLESGRTSPTALVPRGWCDGTSMRAAQSLT